MKKILFYAFYSIAGAVVWSVLNEKITLYVFLTGFISSLIVIYITERYLIENRYHRKFDFNLLLLFSYPFYLIYKIFTSGFFVFFKILKGSISPKITSVKTSIENDLLTSIFANSITLTPGTISIDKDKNKILVLYLDDKAKCILDPQSYIKCRYEKILERKPHHDD